MKPHYQITGFLLKKTIFLMPEGDFLNSQGALTSLFRRVITAINAWVRPVTQARLPPSCKLQLSRAFLVRSMAAIGRGQLVFGRGGRSGSNAKVPG